MKKLIRYPLVIALLMSTAGCSVVVKQEEKEVQRYEIQSAKSEKKSQLLKAFSSGVHSYQQVERSSVAGRVNEIARFIADQLGQNRDFHNLFENPIAVTSIVDLENFKKTNKVGVLLSENLIHELQVRGFKTIDFKMMSAIEITSEGDFVMSKAVRELKGEYQINHVLTGTFSEYQGGIILNVRIVDMATSVVVSSAQMSIPALHYLQLLGDVDSMRPKVVVEKRIVPASPYKNRVELRGEGLCQSGVSCFD